MGRRDPPGAGERRDRTADTHGGFRAGLFLGMGAVSVDVMYAAVSSLSFARLLSAPEVARAIGIAGVILFLCLAVMSFRDGPPGLGRRPDPRIGFGA